MKKVALLLLLLICTPLFSQESVKKQPKKKNKGKMYVLWGWNRAYFSDSDISFKGDAYDFTLQDVSAKDKVSTFSFRDYFNPGRVTIPQTNFRLGYFFHDNYTVSIGVDHMKYVMESYQTVKINGNINNGTVYDGSYNNDDILLTHEFLTFEHTDGLNYINVEVNRFDRLNDLFNFEIRNVDINLTEGIGGGILYPKTNVTIMGSERYDDFNIAGFGLSAKVGLNLTFFERFFLQSDFKYGYINMGNIRTTASKSDSASQHFTFFETTIMFGYKFQLIKQD